ncbi:MAG: acetate--CoA ligase family protein [Planctomycetes bacterium]|nr:acetate--CoA ligase family protein [Planctomycetota bacterium]
MKKKEAPDSLDAVFRPRSIAVVGASRRRHQIGHEIVRNLVEGGFTGPVYPVNPTAPVVHSMQSYPKVSAIPGEVDLAIIVVPSQHVLAVARDCAKKGVGAIVVISAGFAEVGGEGKERQAALMKLCRKHAIRVVGPNCMGVLNTDPEVSMNGTFAATTPTPGGAAFLSQSGALGEAILADARALGVGMSQFASVGNRADIGPPDLLEYWEKDPRTHQILMYLESLGEPERFMEIARRVSRTKPVMVVKSGRTAAGAKAAVSHTGSLAGSEAALDSLFNQCGVLRVNTMKDLFVHARVAQVGRMPAGKRVGIVTNAGGPAILATDACVAAGLEMAALRPATVRKLKKVMPPEASWANPVDLIASADGERFDRALAAVVADPEVDMVIAIFVSPVMIDAAAVARAFRKHAAATGKPFIACLLGKSQGEEAAAILAEAGVPNFRFPEDAANALAGLWRMAELRHRDATPAPPLRVQRKRGREAVESALAAGRELLKGAELYDLLSAYGIPLVPTRIVKRPSHAIEAAARIGWPVVLKVEAPGVVHKSDRGGVILDLRNADELMIGWQELERRFKAESPDMQVLVQAMRRDGVETFFGTTTDPQIGRLIAFGLGGIHVEVLKDVVFRLHPLTPADAWEMVQGIRGKAMLKGVRGKPPVDEAQLVDILLRMNRMLTDLPEIRELDLNPFLAGYEGKDSCVLDARVRLRRI